MGKFDKELGFLGVNVDQALTIDYVKTELINKAEQGDETSIYKLKNIARHGKEADVVEYVRAQLTRLLPDEFPSGDEGEDSKTPVEDLDDPVDDDF